MTFTYLTKERRNSLEARAEDYGVSPIKSSKGIRAIIAQEASAGRLHLPDSFTIDKRTGEIIILCPKRAARPDKEKKPKEEKKDDCPICEGKTTPIVLHRDHPTSDTYAFVNENMFAFLDPQGIPNSDASSFLYGCCLLLWPSNEHKPIHHLTYEQSAVTFDLLADLEAIMRADPETRDWHMQVINNTGKAVGGSLDHPHYQIVFVDRMPGRIRDDRNFMEVYGVSFIEDLIQGISTKGDKSKSKILAEYESTYVIAPEFMEKPYEVIIAPKETKTKDFSDMSSQQKLDFAKGITATTRGLEEIMGSIGREFSYNLLFHTGPHVGTMYLEIVPYSQTDGGFERMEIAPIQADTELTERAYAGVHAS